MCVSQHSYLEIMLYEPVIAEFNVTLGQWFGLSN